MSKIETIIVVGAGKILSSALIERIKMTHKEDVVIIFDEQAKEQNIITDDVLKTLKIESKPYIFNKLPQIEMPSVFYDKHSAKNDCKKGWKK